MKFTKVTLIVFQIFNGLSGILGGYMLINDPSGQSLNMKLEWLQKTPFDNFLIPGIVLFTLNGLGNSFGSIYTITNKYRAGIIAAVFGIIMMVWIISQVSWIGYKNYLQPLYFATGFFQFVLGYYMSKHSASYEKGK